MKYLKLYEHHFSEDALEDQLEKCIDRVIGQSEIFRTNIQTIKQVENDMFEDMKATIKDGYDLIKHTKEYEGVDIDPKDYEDFDCIESVELSDAFGSILGDIYEIAFGYVVDPYFSYNGDTNITLSMVEYYIDSPGNYDSYKTIFIELFDQIISPRRESLKICFISNTAAEYESYFEDNVDEFLADWIDNNLF